MKTEATLRAQDARLDALIRTLMFACYDTDCPRDVLLHDAVVEDARAELEEHIAEIRAVQPVSAGVALGLTATGKE
jgi:hypothetical protein